jgi:serine protease inhibitor
MAQQEGNSEGESDFRSRSALRPAIVSAGLASCQVLNRAFIEVREKRTETTAAVYFRLPLTADRIQVRLEKPPRMVVDRPLLFPVLAPFSHVLLCFGAGFIPSTPTMR